MRYFLTFLTICFLFAFTSCTIESTTHFNKNDSGTVSMTVDMSEIMGFAGSLDDSAESGGNPMDSLFMFLEGKGEGVEADSMAMMLDSIQLVMAEAGLNNFNFSRDGEMGLNMSYDFDDLSVFDGEEVASKLTKAFGSDNQTGMGSELFGASQGSFMNGATVTRQGKWLIIDHSGGNSWDEFMNEMKEEAKTNAEESEWSEGDVNDDDLEGMANGMIDMMGTMFNYESTYSFDRKIKEIETKLPHTVDGNSITLSYSLAHLMELWEEGESLELRVKLK